MPHNYDIVKTISGYYQIVDWTTNSPVGKSLPNRAAAQNRLNELYEEMYGMEEELELGPPSSSKGMSKESPGVDTHSDRKKVS